MCVGGGKERDGHADGSSSNFGGGYNGMSLLTCPYWKSTQWVSYLWFIVYELKTVLLCP